VRRHDSIYRTFNVRAVPVTAQDGMLREWVGICEDISDRRRIEAEIAAKSALFEATLQNMAQAVSVYDSELKLVAYNQHFIDFFEFPAGLITLGRSFEDILWFGARRGDFGSDPEQQVQSRLAAVINKESYRRDFVRANGLTLFVSHTAMPGGGFVNTFTDISEQRRAEQALRESEEHLRVILDNVADAIMTIDKSDFEPFDPRDSITAAVELMARQMTLANIDLTISLPPDCGAVLGRPSQLQQVMIDLLRNAHESVIAQPRTGEGSHIGTIEVSLRAEEGMVRIKVADSGGGMARELDNRIGEPILTAGCVDTGSGLGLWVSQGIVAVMNGRIDVARTLDGAAFTVILPLHHAKRQVRRKVRTISRR
jgi:PAS domain-containing protein